VAVVEDIELRLTVNGLQAQKALDETRASAEKMGGGLSRAVGGLEGLQKSAQALQAKMGPAAAAISGVSSALGQTGGQAGKVVAGVGQLAAAFGAGGPLGVAMVAASMGVDALNAHWQDLTKAQDAALSSIYGATQGYVKSLDDARSRLASARQELATAARGGKEFTPDERKQQLREEAAGRIAAAEATLRQAQSTAELAKAASLAKDIGVSEGEARLMLTTVREAQIKLATRQLAVEKESLQTRINAISIEETLAKRKAEADAKEKAREAARAGAKVIPTGDVQGMLAKERSERLQMMTDFGAEVEQQRAEQARAAAAAAEEAVRAEIADREKWDAYELDLAKAKEDERLRIEKDAAQERKRIREQEIADAQSTYGALVTSAAQALGTFVAETAAGQEDALATLLKAGSQQAGGFIMLQGGQLIAEGIRNSFGVATAPLGAAQIAGGAGLVAAGAAVQVGGPLAVNALLGQAGGGASSSRTGGGDPGARARAPRMTPGEGGGTQLTIVYGGLSGPTADDGARALKKAERRAARRGYT
jgi:hypothetical protein